MAKNLLETYRQIQEGILPDLKKPGIGPGSGQTSVQTQSGHKMSMSSDMAAKKAADMRANVKLAPSGADRIRAGQDSSGYAMPKAAHPPAKPAPAPQAKSANAAIGSANPTDTQRRAGMSITATRNQAYGKGWTPAAKASPTPNTGASGAGPVPNVERPRAPLRDSGIRKSISGTMAKAVDAKMAADAAKRAKMSGGGSGQAQAATTTQKPAAQATPPKPTAKPAQQSWSQKVGQAMRDHVKKGGKAGDTITVDGKKIKVAWKDKAYEKRLTSKYSKSVNEQSHEESLGALEVRRKGEQQARGPRSYRVTTTNESGKRKVRINFEPENKYFAY